MLKYIHHAGSAAITGVALVLTSNFLQGAEHNTAATLLTMVLYLVGLPLLFLGLIGLALRGLRHSFNRGTAYGSAKIELVRNAASAKRRSA